MKPPFLTLPSKKIIFGLLPALAFFFAFASECKAVNPQYTYLKPQKSVCSFTSLTHPNCTECQAGVDDYSRYYAQGTSAPGSFKEIKILRRRPYTNELGMIQLEVVPETGGSDSITPPAQAPAWVELVHTLNKGESFRSTDSVGGAMMMDYFTQETLRPKNEFMKAFMSTYDNWMVSPNNPNLGSKEPAPNRLGTADGTNIGISSFPPPYDTPCIVNGRHTNGLNCPMYDYTSSSNRALLAGCSANPSDPQNRGCNVPGFPIGGGDPLDKFNEIDPGSHFDDVDPDPNNDYPGIPGEPMVRVNGVMAVSCDIYPLHMLCISNFLDHPDLTSKEEWANKKEVYESHGVKAYTLNATSGVVNFKTALTFQDRVDATYYQGNKKVWTSFFKPEDLGLTLPGNTFDLFARMVDTCGNITTGARAGLATAAPVFDQTQGLINESVSTMLGGDDHNHDLIPTDLDPFVATPIDSQRTHCTTNNAAVDAWLEASYGGATEAFCGLNFTENPRTCAEMAAEFNAATGANVPTPTGCECCANECSPTVCDFNTMISPNGVCQNTDEPGNPPGCGPEFQGKTGMTELNTLRISHTADNLYLVTQHVGTITYGCIADLPNILGIQGCKPPQGFLGIIPTLDVPSKLNGYGFSVLNNNAQNNGNFVILIIPEIPIYGEIVLFVDFKALLEGGLGAAPENGVGGLRQKADGGQVGSLLPTSLNGEICRLNQCDPQNSPAGDCDDDGVPNNTDLCPCAAQNFDSPSGCPMTARPALSEQADGAFQVAQLGGGLDLDSLMLKDYQLYVSGGKMVLEMLRESSIKANGEDAISAYAFNITVNIKSLTDTGDIADDLINKLMDAGGLAPLTSDRTPGVSYYTAGRYEGFEIEASRDVSAPEIPQLEACLGRCKEVNVTDGLDNDGDSYLDPGDPTAQVDEKYNPLSTQIELRWREILYNADELRNMLTDLAGYKVYYAENRDQFKTWYDISASSGNEPYGAGTRFPEPGKYQESDGTEFNGFAGESISCVFESATETNCINDGRGFPEDGQRFRFTIRAYDNATPPNYSSLANTVEVIILRNTVPPSETVIDTPITPMHEGRAIKVIWSRNPEWDIRGYAVYRCPANPLDAVKMAEGLLPATYCNGDANYRQVNKDPILQDPGYFIDNGRGYWEGGDETANPSNPPAFYNGDDDGDWNPATDDLGIDGLAGTGDAGEGDNVPTPGEPRAFEWIDCTGSDSSFCGNFADGATDTLYIAADEDRPVLFEDGLIDGYAYYYKVRAVDAPYAGDGYNVPGTCDQGKTRFDVTAQTGCVNPIEDRTCSDLRLKYNWSEGGNCSNLSESYFYELIPGVGGNAIDRPGIFYCRAPQGAEATGMGCKVVPNDTSAPISPLGLTATAQPDGVSINLSWKAIDLDDDPTQSFYNIYRSIDPQGVFSCAHGGCDEPPYAAGCFCDTADDCNDASLGIVGNTCQFPVRICMANENTRAQTVDCNPSDGSKKADGCECDSDDDCISGRSCTYTQKVCLKGDMTASDGWDNDGDGVIDEELNNGIDDDKDGLVDEDLASGTDNQGVCPKIANPERIACYESGDPIRACAYLTDDELLEYIPWTATTFTDTNLIVGKTYYYKIAATDNAESDFSGDAATPPNQGNRTVAVNATTLDTQAPSGVIGTCTDDRPCVEINTEIEPSDAFGKSLTVSWLASSAPDIAGYHVYRASKPGDSTPAEVALTPNIEQFQKITGDLHPHTKGAVGGEDLIWYKDQNLTDGAAYYYYIITAVDKQGNKSQMSESTSGLMPQDSVAPSAPLWTALYTTRSDCDFERDDRPEECTTTIVDDCDEGGVKAVSQGNMLKISWAAHSETVCDKTDSNEIDFTSYSIYRTEGDVTTCTSGDTLVASGLTTTSYTDTGLDNLTKYNYCIVALDWSGNESEPSEIKSGIPRDAIPPDAPRLFTGTALANGKVGLGWLPNLEDDIAGYRVYQSVSASSNSFKALTSYDAGECTTTFDPDEDPDTANDITALNCERVQIGNLMQTVTYYFKLTAIDTFGNESEKTSILTVTVSPINDEAPGAPTDILVRPGFDNRESRTVRENNEDDDNDGVIDDDVKLDDTQIELYWTKNTSYDLMNYKLYRSDSQYGTYKLMIEIDPAVACPVTAHARPDGTESLHTCLTLLQSSDDFPIAAGQKYWYFLASADTAGNVTSIDEGEAIPITTKLETDDAAPAVPDKPEAFPLEGGESLLVRWCENDPADPSNVGLAGYSLRRDTKRSGNFADLIANVTDVESAYCLEDGCVGDADACGIYCDTEETRKFICATDPSVIMETYYYYKVAAFDEMGNVSELSSVSSKVAPVDQEPPSNASALVVSTIANKPNQLVVQWTDALVSSEPGFAGFYLLRNNSVNGTWILVDPVPETTVNEELFVNKTVYVDSYLDNGYTYCYLLQTVDKFGQKSCDEYGDLSACLIDCAIPGENIAAPAKPSGLTSTEKPNKVVLDWSDNSELDLAGYNIYRAEIYSGPYDTKLNGGSLVTVSTYSDETGVEGKIYFYRVTAVDTSGYESSPSSSVSGTKTGENAKIAFNVGLKTGWNLVSLPALSKIQTNSVSCGQAIAGGATAGHLAQFDPVGKVYSNGRRAKDEYLEAGEGFWCYSDKESGNLTLESSLNDESEIDLPLHAGWNLLGNPFDEELKWDVDHVLAADQGTNDYKSYKTNGAVVRVAIWNAESQSYQTLPNNRNIGSGEGFWIEVSRNVTLRLIRGE